MEKEAYTLLGKNLLALKAFSGINLFYRKQNATVMLHTESDLTNATLNGTFVLPPGSFTIISGKEAGLDLKIRPDLISNDTQLTIDPIQKTFQFSIKKCCPCSGAGFQVDFDSATDKPVLTIFPRFVFRNISTSGYVLVNSFKDIPEYHIASTMGRVTLRHVFLPADRKIRFGCFYQLGNCGKLSNVSFGTAAAFQQPTVPADAYFFAKANYQNTITSFIFSKEDQTLTSEVRLVAPIRKDYVTAASVKYVGKQVAATLGLGYECPVHHNRINVTVNSQTQVTTIVQIPLHGRILDNATLGLSAVVPKVDSTFLKDHKVNFGFLLTFE
ncbi:hypothetical protein M9Y10_021127 [Tritrichomonas musculus]|uniref:Uncharacterized protein n=1 Tax=Tritrichomonas musculus TaxID=1915356 RepID=A0ABR2HD62_9EUKA